ncbi:sigma factor-like helix-turn-helix DNA-binding protein [Sphingomonas sp. MMS24-J13]|uniref:sigma factor-like helix-turn-helix DNA-binding protein n=1 Tax=Sphingomonas sp. MMS24-J13 TaxID=3238686 RepID=UPI0038515C1E
MPAFTPPPPKVHTSDMGGDPISELTEAEKEVLRLYLTATDQKEIARLIDRSPSAVEQRLASARRKLGVNRSIDAAHQLAHAEGNPAYGLAIYGSSSGSEARAFALKQPSSEGGSRLSGLRPFPTKGRPWNAQPIGMRLIAIVAGVFLLVLSAVFVVSLGEAISAILRHRP